MPELGLLFVLNTALASVLCFACPGRIPQELSGALAGAFLAACISQAAFLNLLPLLAALCLYRVRPPPRRLLWGMVFGLSQVVLFFDVIIFRLFGRHFDGMVWSVITAPGAGDVLRPGTATALTIAAVVSAVVGGSLVVALWVVPQLVAKSSGSRALQKALVIILLLAFAERVVFAIAGLKDFAIVESVRTALPFYQPFTVKKLARKLGYSVDYRVEFQAPGTEKEGYQYLKLPRSPLGPNVLLRYPNILIIAIEGARSDMLDAACMPNVTRLTNKAWQLRNHFSTGNETRFGLFGLLYGIPGSYYPRVLSDHTASPLLETLRRSDYEFIIRSSANLDYTGCNRTAFYTLASNVVDYWTGSVVDRDRQMTDSFLVFLTARAQSERPFFGFLFYDASHQPYHFPPEDAVFPSEIPAGEINYAHVALTQRTATKFKPNYQNSLHYVDRQIGRVLAELDNSGGLRNTILVIVGDHGEEFGECGYFGHTSAFNRFQTQTLAVVHFPDQPTRIVERLTSHVDIAPSILTWMGVTNALSDYTTGLPIQAEVARPSVVLSGWQTLALVQTNSVMVFKQFSTKLYDRDGQSLRLNDTRRPTSRDISEAMRQSRCFFE